MTGYTLDDINLMGEHSKTGQETVEEIRPIAQVHVMLSFPPDLMSKLAPILEKVKALGNVEIEQGQT